MRRTSEAEPDRVGRYAIQGEIATGGMATVHYGRLVGSGGFTRVVAIKRLHPQYAKDPQFVAMFLDEARLASRIRHPNVVPILDVVAEAGELFLVMEFIPGESLSKLFRTTPEGLPASIVSAIGVGMLEGLHAAHEAQGEDGLPLSIVHRDVSPQNVLVGSDGVARLIDFGVAKAVGNATATRDGQIKGKVAYMAPEQIRAEEVDRRADLYAASVVLWELLTGTRYFDDLGSDAAVILRAVSKEAVAPSSARREISPEIDQVILTGLSRDVSKRYATAREMAQALEKVAPPAPSRDVARWVEAKAATSLRLQAQRASAFDLSIATELPGRPVLAAKAEGPKDADKPGSEVATSATLAAPPSSARPASAAATLSEEPRSTADPSALALDQAAASRPRRNALIIAGVLGAGVIGFMLARLVPSTPSPSPAASQVQSSVASPSAGTLEPRTAAPSPSSQPTSSAASSASATRPALGHDSTVGPRGTSAKPLPTGNKPVSPNCSPPFRITADGLREYKPECLR